MDQLVKVRIVDVAGYVSGVCTTMPVKTAESLAKDKKVKLLDKFPGEGDKKAPDGDKKGGKGK